MCSNVPVAIPNSNPDPDPDPTSSSSSVHTCTVNDTSAGLLVSRKNIKLPADSSSLTTVVLNLTVTVKRYHSIKLLFYTSSYHYERISTVISYMECHHQ